MPMNPRREKLRAAQISYQQAVGELAAAAKGTSEESLRLYAQLYAKAEKARRELEALRKEEDSQ